MCTDCPGRKIGARACHRTTRAHPTDPYRAEACVRREQTRFLRLWIRYLRSTCGCQQTPRKRGSKPGVPSHGSYITPQRRRRTITSRLPDPQRDRRSELLTNGCFAFTAYHARLTSPPWRGPRRARFSCSRQHELANFPRAPSLEQGHKAG
jgi:hypothetical protein